MFFKHLFCLYQSGNLYLTVFRTSRLFLRALCVYSSVISVVLDLKILSLTLFQRHKFFLAHTMFQFCLCQLLHGFLLSFIRERKRAIVGSDAAPCFQVAVNHDCLFRRAMDR